MTATLIALALKFWPFILAGAGIVAAYLKGHADASKSAAVTQKAKEADAYAQHLKDIEAAAYARDHVAPGVPDGDPNNRDKS